MTQWCLHTFRPFLNKFFIMLVISHLMVAKWLPKFQAPCLTQPFVQSKKKENTGKEELLCCVFGLLLLFCLSYAALCLFRKQNLSWKAPPLKEISPYASFSRTRSHAYHYTSQWQREIEWLFWLHQSWFVLEGWAEYINVNLEVESTHPCYIVKLYENIQPVFLSKVKLS